MRSLSRRSLLSFAAILGCATATLAMAASPAVARAGTGAQSWRLVKVFRHCGDDSLSGVAAVSATDVWVIGQPNWATAATCGADVEHWNGQRWQRVAIPRGTGMGAIASLTLPIAAVSARDAWIFPGLFGHIGESFFTYNYALRWTGSGWVRSGFGREVVVDEAAAFSRDDAWVFGSQWERRGSGSYVGRYDGRSWHEVATPGVVAAAAAPAPDAIWVIGPSDKTAGRPLARQALIAMHWTGRRWGTVAVPRVGLAGPGSYLQAAYAVATGPRTLWWSYVVTSTSDSAANVTGLLELNDGHWTVIALPAQVDYIDAMTQDGAGGLWLLAGVQGDDADYQYWYHYSAGAWTRQLVPSPRLYNDAMFGMAWVPGTTQAWAAGEADLNGSKGGPVTEGVLARFGA